MGAWGTEPWDNDRAADWFADLFEGTPIVERVQAGLASDDSDEVVAALWLCTELVRVYVWPIDAMEPTLDAALAAVDRILAGEDDDAYLEMWDGDEVVLSQLQGFRSTLVDRRSPPA